MSTALPISRPGDDPLLDAKQVAAWLDVSEDWVWDHSTRRAPFLPAIWLSDGVLRFRHSAIEAFIDERERLSKHRRKRR
jgi:predicted DNA-binding transcriptional regulator AlpA